MALGQASRGSFDSVLQHEPRALQSRSRLVLEALASEGLVSVAPPKYAAGGGGQEKLGAGKSSEAAEV